MSEKVSVKFKKVDDSVEVFIPEYKTSGSSGMDIMSIEKSTLHPGEVKAVKTNLSVEIPEGYEIQVRPRSGLALNYGITVLNTPGTIDSDYRGEIKVILYNTSKSNYYIDTGDRIAQMVLAKVERMELIPSELSQTDRNTGGFGSTGIKSQ